jgi:hypothetical protein
MPVFSEEEADFRRLDYNAIVEGHGLATVRDDDAAACRTWLVSKGYRIVTVDCGSGWTAVAAQLSDVLRFEDQFGHPYRGRSLDALRDGFELDASVGAGTVLELVAVDRLWDEDARLCGVLLNIACEHTRVQLAAGRRFFTVLVVPRDAELVGCVAFDVSVPSCWQRPGPTPFGP